MIPKKVGAVDGNKLNIVIGMIQVAKTVLNVIGERLKRKVAEYVDVSSGKAKVQKMLYLSYGH